MFVLLTSISQYISEIVLFSEYEILTGRLVNTKLLGFRLLWDVTVYVIDRQNCPTQAELIDHACAWFATFVWSYTTIVAVLTYLSSIILCSLSETHASDSIFLDTTLLPPYPSL
jgi:hypothetical protein